MQPAYLCPVTVFRHSSFLSSARKCLNSSRFRLTMSPTLHHKPLALRHGLVKPPAPRHRLLQALKRFPLGQAPPPSPRLRRAGGGPQGQLLPLLSHEVLVHLHHQDSHYNPHHHQPHAPDSAVPRTALPPFSSQPTTAAPPATASRAAPHTGITSQFPILPTPFLLPSAADASVRLPPLAAQAQPPYYYPPATSFSYQWPAAPAADIHAGNHQPATQSHWPPPSFLPTSLYGLPQASGADPCVRLPPQTATTPPSFPSTSSYVLPQAPGANPCVRLPPQMVTAPLYLPSNPSIPSKSQFTLFTAVPLPTPSNAAALEPPPVPNTIKTQILAGTDIDLSSLLSLLPPGETHRQIDCGDFSVTLKNPTPNSSRPLSFSKFTIAFGRYTETVCSVFPHRRRELNDYLAIVAELALSYGGAHFYTYHKLFSAKCAVRVSQWNQSPYWGALDSDLHNRVFFSCPNISCAVCRSVAHSTISCPQVNPAIIPCPEPTQAKSTSYVPRSTTTNPTLDSRRESIPFSGNQQVCRNFNRGRCTRQQCKYLHVCSYCGGAHARIVCPVSKATNKKSRNYLSTPVNISRLSSELSHHPDTNFTSYLLSGLKQGFNPGTTCPLSHNTICNNLQSALAEPDTVDNLIKKKSSQVLWSDPLILFYSSTHFSHQSYRSGYQKIFGEKTFNNRSISSTQFPVL